MGEGLSGPVLGNGAQSRQQLCGDSLVQGLVVVAALGRLDAARATGAALAFRDQLQGCTPQIFNNLVASLRYANPSWVTVVYEDLWLSSVGVEGCGYAPYIVTVAQGVEG